MQILLISQFSGLEASKICQKVAENPDAYLSSDLSYSHNQLSVIYDKIYPLKEYEKYRSIKSLPESLKLKKKK